MLIKRYKHLPFCLTIYHDIFQQNLDTVFSRNVTVIMDDILVTGSIEEEHDIIMTKVLKRTKENNIGYYPDKLQYKQKRVNPYPRTWYITHRR